MVAGTVTILTFGLTMYIQKVEDRSWVKKLAWCAMGAVILQAVLGGVTVLLHLPTEVSVAHAGLAQIFFSLLIVLTLVTSRNWLEAIPNKFSAPKPSISSLTLVTTIIIYVQIVVGAVTRHSGAGLAIPDFPLSFGQVFPPDVSPVIVLQFSHTRVGAFVVLILVNLLSFRVCQRYTEERALFWPAAVAALLVWVQCFLGILIIATNKAIVPTSVHVITGAALLASMLILTLNSFHLFKKGTHS
jgi:heme A synthase